MSSTAEFTVTSEMTVKQIGVMFRKAHKRTEALDREVTIPFRWSLGLRVIAEKAEGVTASELAEAIGCSSSLLSNAKQVAVAYPDGVPKKLKTWEQVRDSLKSDGAESVPTTSKDKAHAALESGDLTNAEFCKVVTAAARKRSFTAKQRADLIAILEG
jgi:hypothetical protein